MQPLQGWGAWLPTQGRRYRANPGLNDSNPFRIGGRMGNGVAGTSAFPSSCGGQVLRTAVNLGTRGRAKEAVLSKLDFARHDILLEK